MEKEKGFRKAVFVVTYKISKESKKPIYLLLKRKLHWKGWEFTKGGIEKKESPIKTAKREVREESGLNPMRIKKYNFYGRYRYKKDLPGRPYIGQTFSLYSAQIPDKKPKIDRDEHSEYKWLPYQEAIKKLSWKDQKHCLRIVNNFLES